MEKQEEKVLCWLLDEGGSFGGRVEAATNIPSLMLNLWVSKIAEKNCRKVLVVLKAPRCVEFQTNFNFNFNDLAVSLKVNSFVSF